MTKDRVISFIYGLTSAFFLVLITSASLQTLAAHAEDSSEREGKIKAACLYHLIQYIKWPSSRDKKPNTAASFSSCHIGNDPANAYLGETLKNRSKDGLPFQVKNLSGSLAKASTCDLIFASDAEASRLGTQANAKTFDDTLLVASDTCGKRFDVCLQKKANRLAIKLRKDALMKRGFTISSELLQIAEIE
jgi:hypothetical protein